MPKLRRAKPGIPTQQYSTWTVEQFRDQNNREHRHIIPFAETTEAEGFVNAKIGGDPDQFRYHEGWQFGVHAKQDWRVHGILIDDIFYVVWLDPEHRLGGKRSI